MGDLQALLDLLAGTRQQRRAHIIDATKPLATAEGSTNGTEPAVTRTFIVVLEQQDSATSLSERSETLLSTLQSELKPTQLFEAINSFTVQLSEKQASQLQGQPGVSSVEADRPLPLTPPVEVNWGPATTLELNPQLLDKPQPPSSGNSAQAVHLDTYWIESSGSDPKPIQARGVAELAALPTYSNGTASSGEILPYGVKAVWGGVDVSAKGNIGAGTYAFVIDSGVLNTTGDLNINTAWSKSWISGESALSDGNGHGTHVAGTIAALANGKGVVGVAPGAEVISLKVFDSSGGGASYSTIIDAINYATQVINNNGLDKSKVVINMSLGGGYSGGLDQAVKNAANQGIKFAIAAGNSGKDADGYSPASAGDHHNVYTVSAVDNGYQMPTWSNWDDQTGGDDVDVAAPGVGVYSYYQGGQLASLSGTSMAAPHVAGLLLMGGVEKGEMVKAANGGASDPFTLIKNNENGETSHPPKNYTSKLVGNSTKNGRNFYLSTSHGSLSQQELEENLSLRTGILDTNLNGSKTAIDAFEGSGLQIRGTGQARDSITFTYSFNTTDSLPYADFAFASSRSNIHSLYTLEYSTSSASGRYSYELKDDDFDSDGSFLFSIGIVDAIDGHYDSTINIQDFYLSQYRTVTTAGNVAFQKDAATGLYAVSINNGSPIAITATDGTQIHEGIYSGWKTLAAATINGTNTVLWKNTAANRLHTWRLDNNWKRVTSADWVDPKSAAALTFESNFNLDLNGDNTIGANYSTLNTAGNVAFQKDAATGLYAVSINNGSPIAITATDGTQIHEGIYSGWKTLAAATINGTNTVLWKNTAANRLHTWRLDNNWKRVTSADWVDPKSAAALTFESNFNLDLNGDNTIGANYSTLNTAGNVAFQKDAATGLYAVSINNGSPIAITATDGTQIHEGIYSGWKTLAAATINGTNTVLWKNTAANRLHTWRLDNNWKRVTSADWVDPKSAAALTFESNFNLDLNGDNTIGANYSTLNTAGNVAFQKDAATGLYAVSINNGSPIAITATDGTQIHEGIYSGWKTLAAATINGTNTVLWKNTAANRLHTWRLDNNWKRVTSADWVDPKSAAALTFESNFNLDLNGDNTIGANYSTLNTAGNVAFQKDAATGLYAVSINNGSPIAITATDGTQIHEGIYSGWKTLAAATINGTNTVLWKNTAANRLHTWRLDNNWKRVTSADWVDPKSAAALTFESNFNLDLNGDNTIGANYSTLNTAGNVAFQKDAATGLYAVSINNGSPIAITATDGTQIHEGIYSGWKTLAAATINGTNTVLWKNTAANRLHTWRLDNNWKRVTSADWVDPKSAAALTFESNFNLDLNGDNTIGANYSTLNTAGNVAFQKDAATGLYAVSINNGSPIAITATDGTHIHEGIYSGWKTLAAATINGTNTVLWKNTAANRLHTWRLDNNWKRVTSADWVDPKSAAALTFESNFNLDLSGDSVIGPTYTVKESEGKIDLLTGSNNLGFARDAQDTIYSLSWGGTQVGDKTWLDWSLVAAETINSTNLFVMQHAITGDLKLFSADSSWAGTSSTNLQANSADYLQAENKFEIDFNNNGVIGS